MSGPTGPKGVGPPAEPRRILLAEDNKVNQQVAKAILGARGHHVDVANNGEEAVAAVEEHEYDVVLMDVQMPVMDGLAACREIRARGYADLPIVALTAHALQEERDRCREAGMSDFLSKPFEPADLLAMVEAREIGR